MAREWTTKEINLAKDMWQKGLSGKEIGVILGRTKNSIIGKMHSLGIKNKPIKLPKIKPAIKLLPTKPVEHQEKPKLTTDNPGAFFRQIHNKVKKHLIGISLMDVRDGQCRQIICDSNNENIRGKDGNPVCCGERTIGTTSYCYTHAKLNFIIKPFTPHTIEYFRKAS